VVVCGVRAASGAGARWETVLSRRARSFYVRRLPVLTCMIFLLFFFHRLLFHAFVYNVLENIRRSGGRLVRLAIHAYKCSRLCGL